MVGSHSSGNAQIDEKETLSFFVKNIDVQMSARMNLINVIPNNAVLTGFTINNEAAVYELSNQRHREKDEVSREFDAAVTGGYSAVMIGDVLPSEALCNGCKSINDEQPVSAQINVAPLDVLSVSISFYIPEGSGADVRITIELEDPSTNIEGVLFSPNYPETYPSNADVNWNIIVPDIVQGLIINATLLSFDVEQNDRLLVHDGSKPVDYVLMDAELSDVSSSVYTTGTEMLVTFDSDDVNGGNGFALRFITMIPVVTTTKSVVATTPVDIDDTTTTSVGSIGMTTTPGVITDTIPTSGVIIDMTTVAVEVTPEMTTVADTTNVTTDSVTTQHNVIIGGKCPTFIHLEHRCDARDATVDDEEIGAVSGSVFTPGYPFSYPVYPAVLTWLIKSSEKVVYLTLIDVDIRNSELLISFSSSVTPTIITSASEEGLVLAQVGEDDVDFNLQFTSDEKSYSSKSPRGFYLHFTSAEAEELQLVANDNSWKEIMSNEGETYYEEDTDVTWKITAPESSGIEIKIVEFNLEERYDFLFIYEVQKNNSGILKSTLSGTNGKDVTINLSTNVALLRFVTDAVEQRTGFILQYRATALSTYASTSSRTLNASYGMLRSPGYPGYMHSNETTQWLVQAEANQVIKFWVDEYKTNTSSYITFYDGSTSADPQITTFTDKDDYSIISTVSEVLVVLSRGSYTYDSRSYFITFSTMEQEDAYCNGDQRTFTDLFGAVESPAYPLKPTPNTRCNYLIQLPSTSVVLATFEYVGLSPSDLFEIFDGTSMSSPFLMSCGNCKIDDTVAATGNTMYIRYVAEPANRGSGFKLNYQDQTTVCSNVVRTNGRDSGVAISPNFPGKYPNNVRCSYAITVPFDSVIHYYFETFDTGSNDILTIDDGLTRNARKMSGRGMGFSGVSKQNILTMVFETDDTEQHPGFRMIYSTRSDSMLPNDHAYSYLIVNEDYDEGNPLSLLSPGFPNIYPTDFDFLWYFETTPSSGFNFEFHKMEIDRSDFVNIFSSIGTNPDHLIATVNGQSDSGVMWHVNNHNATVWFYTDDKFGGQGFILNYYSVD